MKATTPTLLGLCISSAFAFAPAAQAQVAAPGLHMQGGFGIANVRGVSVDSANFDKDSISVGAGVMFGVGYDWWVSKEWSIGILGRMAVGVTGQEDKADVRWYHAVGGTPSVLFTGTYN